MSLGRALVDAMRSGAEGPVEVIDGDLRVAADVQGSGPYGAVLRGVSVERTEAREGDRGQAMERAVEALAERVQYLPERLAPLELDAPSGRGILRTRRDQVRDAEYYEVVVDGGDRVDVGRFRFDRETGRRRRVGDNLGHRVIERLVDDLADVLAGPEDG